MGVKNEKGCWYHTTYLECPICCWTTVFRERRKGPKPKDISKRIEYDLKQPCYNHYF